MEKGKGSSTMALAFTRSSGLVSALYFFSTQLRTLPPWLLKVTWKRSVSMEKVGSDFAWVAGPVGALSVSWTICVGAVVSAGASAGGGPRTVLAVGAVDFFAGVLAEGKK